MSDLQESYFVDGVELLQFRRDTYLLYAAGEVGFRPGKKRNRRKKVNGRRRELLVIRDGDLCHYCSVKMVGVDEFDNKMMTIEHVVPQAAGGSNLLFNLVLACYQCNHSFGSTRVKCHCIFCQDARRAHE